MMAIIAVAIIAIAGVGAYTVLNGNGGNSSGSTTHALSLDGVEAKEDNVVNGTYEIKRNLVLVTKGEATGNVAAFLDWITSEEGQEVLGEEFVKLPSTSYTTAEEPDRNGKTSIVMGGSTSLSETAEKLAAAYMAKYSFMTISVQGGGSGAGEKSCDSGLFDIGMLSRDMGSTYEGDLVPRTIGQDGVAIIANISGVENLTMEQVAKIFSGEITNWSEVGGPDKKILVNIREDGSGTRECFDNAMKAAVSGWEATKNAVSSSSTGAVITNVQSAEGSIGYISIGQIANI